MDYSRPELADRLAAEYAAGTLRGGARRRFESLLAAHPALRSAVRAWQHRLMPLTGVLAPEPPPPAVWQRVQARIGGDVAKAVGWWARLSVWRGLSAAAMLATLALGVLLALPEAARPPVVVVLAAADGSASPSSFVAGISADGRALVTRPVTPVALQADRALELWSLPAKGAPKSLGLISADAATVLRMGKVPDDTAALAVSLEPTGGSPTGAPTGPVLFVGKL